MNDTERAALVERLEREARYCASFNSYGADILGPLLREAAEEIAALSTPPVPREAVQVLEELRTFVAQPVTSDSVVQGIRTLGFIDAKLAALRAEGEKGQS